MFITLLVDLCCSVALGGLGRLQVRSRGAFVVRLLFACCVALKRCVVFDKSKVFLRVVTCAKHSGSSDSILFASFF